MITFGELSNPWRAQDPRVKQGKRGNKKYAATKYHMPRSSKGAIGRSDKRLDYFAGRCTCVEGTAKIATAEFRRAAQGHRDQDPKRHERASPESSHLCTVFTSAIG